MFTNKFLNALILMALITPPLLQAADHSGRVALLKGKGTFERSKKVSPLASGLMVMEGDIIVTAAKSFVRIIMKDETTLSLGPKSKLVIQEFQYKQGTIRKTIYNLIEGKMRSFIRKKTKGNESVQVNSDTISIAVRGTEILSNSYLVKGNATNDVMLLSGKAEAHVMGMKGGMLDLKSGQALNSGKAIMEGGAVTNVSAETINALKKNPNAFMPNMQDALGNYIKLESAIRSELNMSPLAAAALSGIGIGLGLANGAGALLAGSDSEERKNKVIVKKKKSMEVKKRKKKLTKNDILNHKNIIGHKGKVKLSKLPQDILEAYLRKKKMRKSGECYYWFYKKIPGYGNTERFRRERDCVDYDYDL
jgi:hypothetical protein